MPFPKPITTIEDLAGKTIGTVRAITITAFRYTLQTYTDGSFAVFRTSVGSDGTTPCIEFLDRFNSRLMIEFGLISEDDRKQFEAEELETRERAELARLLAKYPDSFAQIQNVILKRSDLKSRDPWMAAEQFIGACGIANPEYGLRRFISAIGFTIADKNNTVSSTVVVRDPDELVPILNDMTLSVGDVIRRRIIVVD